MLAGLESARARVTDLEAQILHALAELSLSTPRTEKVLAQEHHIPGLDVAEPNHIRHLLTLPSSTPLPPTTFRHLLAHLSDIDLQTMARNSV